MGMVLMVVMMMMMMMMVWMIRVRTMTTVVLAIMTTIATPVLDIDVPGKAVSSAMMTPSSLRCRHDA